MSLPAVTVTGVTRAGSKRFGRQPRQPAEWEELELETAADPFTSGGPCIIPSGRFALKPEAAKRASNFALTTTTSPHSLAIALALEP